MRLMWWSNAVIKGEILPETRITTYVRFGDLLLIDFYLHKRNYPLCSFHWYANQKKI